MAHIEFANKEFLYLLSILLAVIAWYILKQHKTQATLQVSNLFAIDKMPKTGLSYLRHVPFVLRIIILALLIVALARPQSTDNWKNITTEGIDIMLALDISGSMKAQDFKPNRLEASKDVAIEFISGRPYDRIGLVVFSGESFTQCPLTTDHKVLINLFNDIRSGMIEDGTAIGVGLGNAVNRLKDSKSVSRIIILLTDGVNNQGEIAPVTAAEIAKRFNIRVYTIGVGTYGTAPFPFDTPYGVQYQDVEVKIDENTLKEIAKKTNGKYFRATDKEKLKDIYEEIDKLEKSKIEIKKHSKKNEEYFPLVILAGILLLIEILLRITILRSIP